MPSTQAIDHRNELIRTLRQAQSHGIHSLDQSSRDRIFAAMTAVGDWNRNHVDHRIVAADVLLPNVPTALKT